MVAKHSVVIAALGMVMNLCALESATLPERVYSKPLTLSIAGDLTLEQALQAHGVGSLSDFTAAKYDKLVKTGSGTLILDQDILSFSGDIFIEAGRVSVTHKYGLGKRTTDSFVAVRVDATLEYATPATYGAKTVYFEGDGIDAQGSLQVANTVNSTSEFWRDVVFVMTGDSTIRVNSADNRKTASFLKSSVLYMNGHTATSYFGSNDFQFSFGVKVQDSGCFVIRSGNVNLDDALQLPKDGENGSCLRLDGCKVNFASESYPEAFWPIVVVSSPSAFKVAGNNTVWQGSLELLSGTVVRYTDANSLTFEGGLSGTGRMIVEGSGLLRVGVADEICSNLTISRGGVVCPSVNRIQPGLVAGYSSDSEPAGYSISTQWNDPRNMPTLTNEIEVLSFARLQNSGVDMPGSGKQVYTYSGYVMNMEAEERTWAFLCNLKHRVDLRIGENSSTLFENWDKYAEVRAVRVVLRPGANKFVLKCWVNGTKGGRYTSLTDAKGKVYPAFAVIRDVSDEIDLTSTLASDWEQVTGDPGDGSLFRVARNDADILAVEAEGLKMRPMLGINRLVMASEGSLHLSGNDVRVESLEGAGAVVKEAEDLAGNVFQVEAEWILSPNDGDSWPVLMSDVEVAFGDHARLVIDADAFVRSKPKTLVSSHVGIRGLPELVFSDGRIRSYALHVAADGKSFELAPTGLIVVFR